MKTRGDGLGFFRGVSYALLLEIAAVVVVYAIYRIWR